MSGTGFSGNVVLNICELDDTHLKREKRWEGAMIEGRKEGGQKGGRGEMRRNRGVARYRGSKTLEKQKGKENRWNVLKEKKSADTPK